MESIKRREEVVEKLGPLGNMVFDLAYRLKYPIQDPPELANFYKPEQEIIVRGVRFSIAQVAIQFPEEQFPIENFEDLVVKIAANFERVEFNKESPYKQLLAVLQEKFPLAYSNPYPEDELRIMAKNYKMEMGGPETLRESEKEEN